MGPELFKSREIKVSTKAAKQYACVCIHTHSSALDYGYDNASSFFHFPPVMNDDLELEAEINSFLP